MDSLRFSSIFAVRYAHARGALESATFDPTAATLVGLRQGGTTTISVQELALCLGAGLFF